MNMHVDAADGGAAFELTPILEPLAPFRITCSCSAAWPQASRRLEARAGRSLARADSVSDGRPREEDRRADLQAGVSIDQIVAKELGKETQLASLELALESNDMVGACDAA